METRELSLRTGSERFHDLTREVRRFVGDAGVAEGLLNAYLPHATAGLALIETGAGSEQDLSSVIDDLLPREEVWRHGHGSPGHGADHVMPAFIGPSLVIPVADGGPALGTWQSVVLVDPNVDNPTRTVRLSLLAG